MRGVEVETFYGRDGVYPTPYLTRVALSDWLSLHVFHRGDADPDPHDHVRAFVTLPLTSYVEEVYDPDSGLAVLRLVRAGRLHFRAATYAHRVVGRWIGLCEESGAPVLVACEGGIVTLVLWIGRKRDTWGFWRREGGFVRRTFVPWRDYIFGEDE